MLKIITSFLLLAVIISCSLEHSNPLDPENSGIDAPPEITGIDVNLTAQDHVSISWNSLQNISGTYGYYLYRSFSEDGEFSRIETLSSNTSSYLDMITITNYNTWYKLSAYVVIGPDSLEGIRSAAHTWNN